MGTGEFSAEGNPAMDWHPVQDGGGGGCKDTPSRGDKRRPDGPSRLVVDFTCTIYFLDKTPQSEDR